MGGLSAAPKHGVLRFDLIREAFLPGWSLIHLTRCRGNCTLRSLRARSTFLFLKMDLGKKGTFNRTQEISWGVLLKLFPTAPL